jgi:hypothetical protein
MTAEKGFGGRKSPLTLMERGREIFQSSGRGKPVPRVALLKKSSIVNPTKAISLSGEGPATRRREGSMNLYLSIGLFSLYAGLVSLFGLLAEREMTTVLAAKRHWGRKRGLTLYFLVNIAFPLVFGIVFFSRGVAGFGSAEPSWGLTIPPLTVTQQEPALQSAEDSLIKGDFVAQYVPQMKETNKFPQDLTNNPLLLGYP